MWQKIFRKLLTPFLKPVYKIYLNSNKEYKSKPFSLTVLKGVFHPGLFFSSKYLLKHLLKYDFNNKRVIEVGAGSGLISFHLAQHANEVIAIELSDIAVQGLIINQKKNKHLLKQNVLKIVKSNLFEKLDKSEFDYIIVNPPYFPNEAKNEEELAWNCGKNFEYFFAFFENAKFFMNKNSKIIMVLSDQCNINKIQQIAHENKFDVVIKDKKSFLIENNLILHFALS